MTKRIRVVGWNVQPVVMLDDGTNLIPLEVSAQMIPAAQWQAFKDGGDEAGLASLRKAHAGGPNNNRAGRRAKRHPV